MENFYKSMCLLCLCGSKIKCEFALLPKSDFLHKKALPLSLKFNTIYKKRRVTVKILCVSVFKNKIYVSTVSMWFKIILMTQIYEENNCKLKVKNIIA